MRLLTLALAIFMTVALTACGGHRRRHYRHHKHAKVVVIKRDHKHTDQCGHYKHGGKWYHHHGHHHKSGCGHKFVGGIWHVPD